MWGIVGANGLIGGTLYRRLQQAGEPVVGSWHSRPRPGLQRFDLAEGGIGLFAGCTQVLIAGSFGNIDQCRRQHELAYRINVERTLDFIAELAGRDILPVFISSNQVFDGRRGGYREEDATHPLNNYGRFKLAVEQGMQERLDRFLILRLPKLYRRPPEAAGLWREIAEPLQAGERVYAAHDLIFNPTEVGFVIDVLLTLQACRVSGLLHVAQPTVTDRYRFSLAVAGELGVPEERVVPVALGELELEESRPLDVSLDCSRLQRCLQGEGL